MSWHLPMSDHQLTYFWFTGGNIFTVFLYLRPSAALPSKRHLQNIIMNSCDFNAPWRFSVKNLWITLYYCIHLFSSCREMWGSEGVRRWQLYPDCREMSDHVLWRTRWDRLPPPGICLQRDDLSLPYGYGDGRRWSVCTPRRMSLSGHCDGHACHPGIRSGAGRLPRLVRHWNAWWRHWLRGKNFPHNWPFMEGIHLWPVDSLHKGLVICGALILVCR